MQQRNTQYNVINAVLAAIAVSLANQYVSIYAVKLGADNLQLGYLSSWPQMASVVAVLVVAGAISRSQAKQRLIAGIYMIGRVAGLVAAAVPYFPQAWRVWALIASTILVTFPYTAANNAMQAFLADVFPGTERGRAFAARNAWSSGAGTATVLITGWLLDHLFPYPQGYQIMFVGSGLIALFEIYYFLKLKAPAPSAEAQPQAPRSGLAQYWHAFSHKPFRTFLLFSIPFHFTWQMAWPIFTRYQVTDLGANNSWLSWFSVAGSLTMIVAFKYWARWAERWGNRRMLGWAALHLATGPAVTAFFPSLPGQLVVNLWTGIGVAGISLLVLNTLLEVSPAEGRTVYLGVHTALVSVSASIAPMVGAFLMDLMPTRLALGLCTIPRVLTGLGFFLMVWLDRRKGIPAPAENISTPEAAL